MLIILWVMFSAAGVLGVGWLLWWQRDGNLYAGKSIAEQRRTVFERSGLIAAVLPGVQGADSEWPLSAAYTLKGDDHTGSYVKYLLAPRIPSGDPARMAVIHASGLELVPPLNKPDDPHEPARPSPAGWLLALLMVFGLGVLVAPSGRYRFSASVPESVALGCMGVCAITLISRGAGIEMAMVGRWITAAGMIGLARLVWRAIRRGRVYPRPAIGFDKPDAAQTLIVATLFIVLVAAVLLAWRLATVVVPDDWDAWAIWGAKAKVLALGSGPLSDVIWFGHADYPLLWPAVWAYSGWLSGGWDELWARGWSAVFLGLAGWQLAVTVWRLGGGLIRGLFAAVLFVTIPKVVVVASWGYAEPALWLFMVCALSRAIVYGRNADRSSLLLASVFVAGAAWTKNEGVLFAGLLMGQLGLTTPAKCLLKKLDSSLLVVMILYLPWMLWVRFGLELDSHATAGIRYARVSEILARIVPGWSMAWNVWWDVRQWGLSLVILAGWTGLALWRWQGMIRDGVWLPWVYLASLFAVNVCHTADIYWQMGASWDRLTIQTIPLLVLTLCSRTTRLPDPCTPLGAYGRLFSPAIQRIR